MGNSKHNPLVEQMDWPLMILSGFQRLKPTGVAAFLPFLPHRRRYVYVDTVAPGGGVELTAKYLHEHGVPSFKFESIELAHCGSGLVVVICSIRRRDVRYFIDVMHENWVCHALSEHGTAYKEFLLGLHEGFVKVRYEN